MEMTTIKALAAEQKVSYQSIWKMVTKYEKELDGHIVVKDRVRYLDDEAVAFILEKRRDHPMVAMNDDQAAIILSQEQEIKQLKDRIEALLNEIIQNEKHINELQKENQTALEAKIQNQFLLEDRDRLQKGYDQLREKSEQLRDDLEAARKISAVVEAENQILKQTTENQREELNRARAEADSFQRSIFGFYRKKK